MEHQSRTSKWKIIPVMKGRQLTKKPAVCGNATRIIEIDTYQLEHMTNTPSWVEKWVGKSIHTVVARAAV
jgi:hypothetical protein